jgi:hypothetical protein
MTLAIVIVVVDLVGLGLVGLAAIRRRRDRRRHHDGFSRAERARRGWIER